MLLAVTGNTGAGKTLFMTYMVLMEHIAGTKIYANYNLFGIPYYQVESPAQFDQINEGFFAADELWLWADSRQSMRKQNKFISKVVARSRHKKVDIMYTVQDLRQMESRIRRVTDVFYKPRLIHNETVCVAEYYNKRNNEHNFIKFKTAPIFNLYDTYEDLRCLEYGSEY